MNSGPKRRARPGIERHDAVGEQQRLVDIVGDEQNGLPLLRPDRLDLVLQIGARQRIERRERLVKQQHFRVHGERAGYRNALAHAAGEFGRPALGGMTEADHARHIA